MWQHEFTGWITWNGQSGVLSTSSRTFFGWDRSCPRWTKSWPSSWWRRGMTEQSWPLGRGRARYEVSGALYKNDIKSCSISQFLQNIGSPHHPGRRPFQGHVWKSRLSSGWAEWGVPPAQPHRLQSRTEEEKETASSGAASCCLSAGDVLMWLFIVFLCRSEITRETFVFPSSRCFHWRQYKGKHCS